MRTQKNWFKKTLMTLAAVGLMIGAFTLSAQAQDYPQGGGGQQEEPPKEENGDNGDNGEEIIAVLHNQFEAGTYVKVKDLELLCVPTHKEIYEGGGKQDDGQQEEPPKEEPSKDEYKYDHLACYKVKDYEPPSDGTQGDDKKY
jgi:hypothetical protein